MANMLVSIGSKPCSTESLFYAPSSSTAALQGLTAPHGIRPQEFLTTLDEVRLTCDLDAGSEVPPEPVAQRRAPLLAGGRMPVSGDNGIGLLADELPSLVERRTAPER
jgi:hypothetical protein